MASLADVFTKKESTNWLKAWLALDIAKSGLDHFAENEAKTLHLNIYNAVWSSVKAPAVCFGCHTANLLKCPTPGVCNKRGANSSCKAMHDTVTNQPRPCPTYVCNKVLNEIKNLHRFACPSWTNTRAELWAQNPWQIAKAYFPPDGYTAKNSVQDTDFNGIISFMMNCKHFDNKFSFPICSGKSNPPCLLTKAREIGRNVRHSSQCKLTDADLQVIFTTLTDLLTDPTCLRHIVASQEAVKKLAKLQHDVLKISTEEIFHLLEAVQDKLKKIVKDELKEVFQDKDKEVIHDKVKEVENIAEKTLQEIRLYLEHCRNDLKELKNKCKHKLDEHTGQCKVNLSEHTEKCELKLDEHTANCEKKLNEHTEKCEVKLDEHTGKCEVKLDEHSQKCEVKLDEHTEKLKNALDGHSRKSVELNYEQSCKDLRRRLIEHYIDNSSYVPISNLDQSLDKRITDIYATPKINRFDIKKDGTRKKEEPVSSYKEMFYKNDNANRRIYVQGEPGSGKSTFAAKLVHDWCHENQPLFVTPNKNTAFKDLMTIQTFKFLFFISLRNMRGHKDIIQMIKYQLVDRMYSEDDLDGVYKLLKTIIETEQCLVVRDGLDEWLAPDGCDLAEPTMAGFQKDKVTVLTTTRPWKLGDERIKNSQIDVLLEIDGISDPDMFCENILGCIIDETKDLDKTVDTFKTFVEQRKLKSLSSSPMLYTLVICMWVDTTKEEEQLTEYSLCALYTSLLESLCKKTNSSTGYFNESKPSPVDCFSSTSYLQPNIEHLDKLAAAACKLLFSFERETSIVFSDITLSNFFSREEFTVCKTFALKSGILTNRKDKGRTGSSNSFIHKTVQEFLAAYYIACNTHVIDVIIDYLHRYPRSFVDISQVFIFLCGMNTIAANALSGLMNECHVRLNRCFQSFFFRPCALQNIMENGIKEAAATKQDGICPKLSHFNITVTNIRDLHRIWSANASSVRILTVAISLSDPESSVPVYHGEPKSHFEFNLSPCPFLGVLHIEGTGVICLKDSASLVKSEFPVWIVLHNADSTQFEDPHPVLPLIKYIELEKITCSSSFLRSLFKTLLTLDHEVMCHVSLCVITSSVGDAVSGSSTYTCASIRTGLNNTFNVHNAWISPGCWEALDGQSIKVLCFKGLNKELLTSFFKFLKSLTQLDTLHIDGYIISPDLWDFLQSLNIKSVNLSQKGTLRGVLVNNVWRLSEVLISPRQMERIYIDMHADLDLLGNMYGMNIKSLCLCGKGGDLEVKHVSALCKSLSSLKLLDKLDVIVENDSPELWKALHDLNIKSLSLSGGFIDVSMKHASAFTQLLASLKQLEILSVEVSEDWPGLWEALRGLNITCLSLSSLKGVKHVSTLTQSLATLTQLDTLCINVSGDSHGLLEALLGVNIKCLNIKCRSLGSEVLYFLANHEELMSKSLETLSIKVEYLTIEVFEAINGLNIKSLNLSGVHGYSEDIMLHKQFPSLSSLSQLETLTLYLDRYRTIPLPQSLKYLNIYCDKMMPSEIGDIVNSVSACTGRVNIKLVFSWIFNLLPPYIELVCGRIKKDLETLKNAKVTRFLTYAWKPSIGTDSDWCINNVVVNDDGHQDDDIGDDELYEQFGNNAAKLYRVSMRVRVN